MTKHRIARRLCGIVQEIIIHQVNVKLSCCRIRVLRTSHGNGRGIITQAIAGFILDRGVSR
ncbi:Uncharacterised protein [Vibrio cholerae]|nr:Uncharacterised protein [Vibrio cholerae]